MLNYYNTALLILAFLVIWIPWIWRYYYKPRCAKASLKQLLKNHPEVKQIIDQETALNKLYKNFNAKRISQNERKRLEITEDAFVYGEIEFLPFYTILDRVKPQIDETFYDLGSGSGKAVMAATTFFDIAKSIGIELLPGLFSAANQRLRQAQELNLIPAEKVKRATFINDNFIHYDFSDGDIIFINATCLDYSSWEKILSKLSLLKLGARVIVTTKKIELPHFKSIYQGVDLMSWGMNSVNIYSKIS